MFHNIPKQLSPTGDQVQMCKSIGDIPINTQSTTLIGGGTLERDCSGNYGEKECSEDEHVIQMGKIW